MNGSQVGLLVISMLVAALVRPAASDSCREEERDAEGKCPKKQPPPRPAPPKPTQLDIQGADMTGAQVSLDGQPAGRGPLILPTRPGRHLIEVKKDGYVPYSESVEVKKGERRLIRVTLQPAPAELEIRGTEIIDAQVWLDGKEVGRGPRVLPTTPTRHLVEVKKDRYLLHSELIELKGGERRLVEVKLQSAATAQTSQSTGTKPESCPVGMVWIPAGTFLMGSPDGVGDANEHPQHMVTLSAYCIDKTEVSVKAYSECVAARRCHPIDLTESEHCNHASRPTHPVNCVDSAQAENYCKWVHKRLPTEAEWEYAARSADGRMFPWGNKSPSAQSPSMLNACGAECGGYFPRDAWATTAPVGSFPAGASPFGVLDMAGNVWEWTADWPNAYSAAAVTNPKGGNIEYDSRMARGGGWFSVELDWVRTTTRLQLLARSRRARADVDIGFRCASGK